MPKEKSVYVVLTHRYRPTVDGKWEVHETCDIVDRIKNAHTRESTVIVNLSKQKLEKNRSGTCDPEQYSVILSYLKNTYPDQFEELKSHEAGTDISE